VVHVVLPGQPALASVGCGGPLVGLADHLLTLGVEVIGDSEELGNRHLVLGMKFRFGI
jgi:hypothetical protein